MSKGIAQTTLWANLLSHFQAWKIFSKPTIVVFREPVTSLIHQSVYDNLSVMPSGRGLLELEHKLESRYKMCKLKECLDELMQDFDRIYLDTPPAFNFFSRSAMIAADRIVVPFDCDTFSKQALYQSIETIEEIKADHNAQLSLEAIIPNQVPARANLPQQLIDELKARLASCFKNDTVIERDHARISRKSKAIGVFKAQAPDESRV